MAELTCTIREFHKFIGPCIRNRIQLLTKKRKRELNHICQACGQEKELEAAHVNGKNRKLIIDSVLDRYRIDGDTVKVDLLKVEEEIMSAHRPIDEYFKFLCSKCHKEYDSSSYNAHEEQ